MNALHLEFRTVGDATRAKAVIDDRLTLSPIVGEVISTIEQEHVGFAEAVAVIGVTVAIVQGSVGLVKGVRDLLKELEGLIKDIKELKDADFLVAGKAVPVNDVTPETIMSWIQDSDDRAK
jgi:hypothetical protein